MEVGIAPGPAPCRGTSVEGREQGRKPREHGKSSTKEGALLQYLLVISEREKPVLCPTEKKK